MYQAVHFDGRRLLKAENYLRSQDIVYRSPAYKGYDALPFGDGDTTYLFWNTEREMMFHINKSDAVDFGPNGDFRAWGWESEEKNTAQVHCARIRIGDAMPSFDTHYLKEFEQRLILQQGRVDLRSQTSFSTWSCSTFASFPDKVMIAKISCASSEPVERKITLEAWGSRSFFHFYEQLVDDGSIRTEDTRSGQKDGAIYVIRRLSGTVVATCLKIVGAESGINLPNRHAAELILPKSGGENFVLLSATVTAESDEGLIDRTFAAINKAAENIGEVEENNTAHWRHFWEQSFVHLKDEYLENIYNFNLYSLNCCCHGKYPVSALGGAWTWNADVRNWGHFYHWNGQQAFWGLEEANHPELAMNYYEFRCRMLENAEHDARKYFKVDGAFFSDICNLNGYQAIEPDTVRNLTVGPQIALDLYRHYQYSADEDFLRNKAYPFMKAAVRFYMGLLVQEDGVCHISGGCVPYESYWNLKDTITDFCMIKVLAKALGETESILNVKDEDTRKFREFAADLFQMPIVEINPTGGQPVKALSAGIKWDGHAVGFTEGDYPRSPFPACQLAAIFPSGLIGLKDRETERFEIAVNTVRTILDTEFYQQGKMGVSGHTPIPQAVARLGMKSDMILVLNLFVRKYQHFSNGFMHYLPDRTEIFEGEYHPRLLTGAETNTVWNNVHEKSEGERVALPKEDFVHMYYEPSSNFMCGVNEMLLQSHDGVIRVFPAVPDSYTAMFTLKAKGNFLVTSEMIDGEIMYLAIQSLNGGKCTVHRPWSCGLRVKGGAAETKIQAKGDEILFETEVGRTYVMERSEYPLDMYYTNTLQAPSKSGVKRLGPAILGKERHY